MLPDQNVTKVQLSVPRSTRLSNGVVVLDCFEFRFFVSNLTSTPLDQLMDNYDQLSTLYATTNSTCLLCAIARKFSSILDFGPI